jgi:hypothetical protein
MMTIAEKIKMACVLAVPTACLIGAMATTHSPHLDAAAATAPPPPVVAEVGAEVELEYPATTILCSRQDEASQLFLTSKMALAQSIRVDRSPWAAAKAERDARDLAMRRLTSCQWAPDKLHFRYRIDQKHTSGTEDDFLHSVSYCLRPDGKTSCWWAYVGFGDSDLFKGIKGR